METNNFQWCNCLLSIYIVLLFRVQVISNAKAQNRMAIEWIAEIKHTFMEAVNRKMVFEKIMNKLCKLAICKLNILKETAHSMKASSNSFALAHYCCV